MSFKTVDAILQPDPRFADLYVVRDGQARRMRLADHHGAIASIELGPSVPTEVQAAFDRARNTLVYAFFDYDLLVVGEGQALSAFELALKHRLNAMGGAPRGTLRNLVDKARKLGVIAPLLAPPLVLMDPIEALIGIRNALLHGNAEIHSPGMALDVVEACAREINAVFPAQARACNSPPEN